MPDQKESLYFGDGLPQSSTQVVSDSRQQDTKQWDSYQSIENAEELSSFRLGRDVTKTWHLGGREGQRFTDTFRVFEVSFNEWGFYRLCCVPTNGCDNSP